MAQDDPRRRLGPGKPGSEREAPTGGPASAERQSFGPRPRAGRPPLADGPHGKAAREGGPAGLPSRLRRSAWRADAGCIALLWALCLLYSWRLFSPLDSLRLHVVHGDFTNQFYPFRHFAAAEWGQGRVPLWNPFVFAGHPFLADVQTAVFYPLSLANALLHSSAGLPMIALEAEMAIHYPLAALFTYLLGKRLIGSRLGATIAALAFTFGGFLTSYPAQQLAIVEAAVWLPLIVLCLEMAASAVPKAPAGATAVPNQGRPAPQRATGTREMMASTPGAAAGGLGLRWYVAAGLAFGVSILAGHPQTALFISYASLAYLVYRTVTLRRAWGPALVGAVVFVAVGFGLAAVQVLPTAELLGASTRASMPYEAAAHGYERRALLGILLPGWRGEKALYVGVLPLLLAGLAMWRAALARRRDPMDGTGAPFPTGFMVVLAVLAVVASLGGRGYLFRALYHYAPGFALFRDQERIIYLYGFAVSLLAGSGASYLHRLAVGGLAKPRWLSRALALALVCVLLGSAGLLYLGRRQPDAFDPHGALDRSLALFGGLLLVSLAALFVQGRWGRARLFAGLAVGIVAVDLFAVNLGNNLSPVDPDPGPRYSEIVARVRAAPEEYRVRGESDEVFPPNYAAVWGLPTISGDTPFALQRVSDFLYAENAEWRRWQVLNVKYFFNRGGPFEGLEPVMESQGIKVNRMVHSLPRAWAVRQVEVADDPADALRRVLDPKYHPGDTAVLETPPTIGPFVKGDRPDVEILSYSPQRITLAARGDGNALLVLADTHYPGWRALVDGQPATLHRANYVVRAVELPPGEHLVEMVFDPISFRLGAAISVTTLVASVVTLTSALAAHPR